MGFFTYGRDVRNSALIPALLLVAVTGCLKKSMDSARTSSSPMTQKLGESILDSTPVPSPISTPGPVDEGKPIEAVPADPIKAELQAMTDFVLGGDGPGSCGLPADPNNTCRDGRTAIACPAGYLQVASIGDCYVTPNYGPQCFGNRPLCTKTGKDVRPVVGFHLFLGGACPEGWESLSGNVGLARGHVYGIVTGPHTNSASYQEAVWCKQTKDIGAILPTDRVLKNVGVFGISAHATTAPGCPAGYEDAGGIPDCSNFTRDPRYQWCSGMIRVCKAF